MNTTLKQGLKAALAGLTTVAAMSGTAWAVPIGGLFNTGVDGAGVAVVGGDGVTDTHYNVFSSTIGGVTTGVSAVTYKHPAYLAETASYRWISHSSTGSPGSGTTVFRTTFDLTGLDASSASISGLAASDNAGDIFLNGVDVGNIGSFSSLGAFAFSAGFVAGINTLDFAVQDFGPPLALLVGSLSGTADIANGGGNNVPEPGSLALIGLGLVLLAARRKTQV